MNIRLKAGRHIYKFKKHHQIFKQSISCPKSCSSLIIFSDLKAIVNILHINFFKYSSNIEEVKYLINQRKKILTIYRYGIYSTEI